MRDIISDSEFRSWLEPIKQQIHQAQIKASFAINKEMIGLYWYLGKRIVEQQTFAKWGNGFIETVSKELCANFPQITGFSTDNIRFMKRMYLFYNQDNTSVAQLVQQSKNLRITPPVQTKSINEELIVAQAVQQFEITEIPDLIVSIPWGHHTTILRKIKDLNEAIFYISKTVENNWSRSVLEYQIETNLYHRQGKAITNFKNSLPAIQSDLANALLKDPYNFEFITLAEQAKEKDLELKLIQHISQFLLELGKGFAYMGRQFLLKVGSKEYRTDLLFYHTRLKCYIIFELKHVGFEPEFVGKLNFYISAIDELVKDAADNPTIGILLCKNKDNYEVEFSLRDINKPIGVSEYRYKELPENIKQSLPSLEELTNELRRLEED
jgi:predicted nuclease of restriction endonuclease-like (RecB) superfamily